MKHANFTSSSISTVKMYNQLRNEWVAANSKHTKSQLQSTCIECATTIGLKLRSDLTRQVFMSLLKKNDDNAS